MSSLAAHPLQRASAPLTSQAPQALADVAPKWATLVNVSDSKDGRGVVRAIRPGFIWVRQDNYRTGKAERVKWWKVSGVEQFQYFTPTTLGSSPRAGGVLWTLGVDMDHEDSYLRLMEAVHAGEVPEPSWVVEKFGNGHGQAGWITETVALGPNADPRIIAFAEDIRQALTAVLGGDPGFINRRMWNPFWPGWAELGSVQWGHVAPRSLSTLYAELKAAGSWPTAEKRRELRAARKRVESDAERALMAEALDGFTTETGERNVFVFDMARLRRSGAVEDAAAEANSLCSPPLPAAEVRGIVRSIEGFEADWGAPWERQGYGGGGGKASEAFRALQAARGRVGGSKGTQAQREARRAAAPAATAARQSKAAQRAAQARVWVAEGVSVAEVAGRLGVTPRSVRGWLAGGSPGGEISGASGYLGGPGASRAPSPGDPPASHPRTERSVTPSRPATSATLTPSATHTRGAASTRSTADSNSRKDANDGPRITSAPDPLPPTPPPPAPALRGRRRGDRTPGSGEGPRPPSADRGRDDPGRPGDGHGRVS